MSNIRNTEVIKQFGREVRKLRMERRLTQEQLAEEAKISQVQVARIETGEVNTTVSTIVAISRALKVHPGKLFDGTADSFFY